MNVGSNPTTSSNQLPTDVQEGTGPTGSIPAVRLQTRYMMTPETRLAIDAAMKKLADMPDDEFRAKLNSYSDSPLALALQQAAEEVELAQNKHI